MNIELLERLEKNIMQSVETIELQRMELDELREENARLKAQQSAIESKVEALIRHFDQEKVADELACAE